MGIMFSPGCADCGCPGGPIVTDCCPDLPLPLTLFAQIVWISGGFCQEYPLVDVELTWDEGNQWWYGETAALEDCVWQVRFRCVDSGSGYRWRPYVCLSKAAAPSPCTSAFCQIGGVEQDFEPACDTDPFELSWDEGIAVGALSGCCGCEAFGAPTFTVTITE